MPNCTRQLEFDATHRVWKHESKCKHIHGHRYVVDITCDAKSLDGCGRVIDFGKVKEVVGKWIDDNLDHNTIINSQDVLARMAPGSAETIELVRYEGGVRTSRPLSYGELWQGKDPYILKDMNPTAEVLAMVIGQKAAELLKPYLVKVTMVRVYETPKCWADWEPEDPSPLEESAK